MLPYVLNSSQYLSYMVEWPNIVFSGYLGKIKRFVYNVIDNISLDSELSSVLQNPNAYLLSFGCLFEFGRLLFRINI
jgi:hypothetical protein